MVFDSNSDSNSSLHQLLVDEAEEEEQQEQQEQQLLAVVLHAVPLIFDKREQSYTIYIGQHMFLNSTVKDQMLSIECTTEDALPFFHKTLFTA